MLGYLLPAKQLITSITAQVNSNLSWTPLGTDTSTSHGKQLDFSPVISDPTAHTALRVVRLDGNFYTCSWMLVYLGFGSLVGWFVCFKSSNIGQLSRVTIMVHHLPWRISPMSDLSFQQLLLYWHQLDWSKTSFLVAQKAIDTQRPCWDKLKCVTF